MACEVQKIATRFVDLALRYPRWSEAPNPLPEADLADLFWPVKTAGFVASTIVMGRLKGRRNDQDRSAIGEYVINTTCPCIIQRSHGSDAFLATGWLNDLLCRIVHTGRHNKEDRDTLIQVVVEEIKRSVPLAPIQLTRHGDLLTELPRQLATRPFEYLVDHVRDHDTLKSSVGEHKFCGGIVDRVPISEFYFALLCRKCYLRVPFPKTVTTYGALRQFLEQELRSSR